MWNLMNKLNRQNRSRFIHREQPDSYGRGRCWQLGEKGEGIKKKNHLGHRVAEGKGGGAGRRRGRGINGGGRRLDLGQ